MPALRMRLALDRNEDRGKSLALLGDALPATDERALRRNLGHRVQGIPRSADPLRAAPASLLGPITVLVATLGALRCPCPGRALQVHHLVGLAVHAAAFSSSPVVALSDRGPTELGEGALEGDEERPPGPGDEEDAHRHEHGAASDLDPPSMPT